jgi:integrase
MDLALNTGLRRGEQYGLRWQEVSLARRTLTIPRSKNGHARHVALNRASLTALGSLKERTGSSELVCGGYVGPGRWFGSAVKTAGLTAFTWHCLRHTFASRLVMSGVDLRTVQELMGHKTIGMTVRYAHLTPKHTLAAVQQLDAWPRNGFEAAGAEQESQLGTASIKKAGPDSGEPTATRTATGHIEQHKDGLAVMRQTA